MFAELPVAVHSWLIKNNGHETYLKKICVIAPARLKKGQRIPPDDFNTSDKRNGAVLRRNLGFLFLNKLKQSYDNASTKNVMKVRKFL
jgi:hypothetical protein